MSSAELQMTWAAGLMLEAPRFELSILATSQGEGTPVIWGGEQGLTWAWFGAEASFADRDKTLTTAWIRRLIADPLLARELSGVFALMVVDSSTRSALIVGDRLGIQGIHHAKLSSGSSLISTHLMWLLLKAGHDGRVDDDAFLTHVAFGYPVGPHDTPYAGVRKVGPAGFMRLAGGDQITGTYWVPPRPCTTLSPTDEDELIERLRTASTSSRTDGQIVGLTSGKDSLCLMSAIDAHSTVRTGTFGAVGCADQIQALMICRALGWSHTTRGLCAESEFFDRAHRVAFHSGGLATISYVDMTAFVDDCVPLGHALVMGEGGECVRDFFSAGGRAPLDTLQRDYMTPGGYLRQTLAPRFIDRLAHYPEGLMNGVRSAGPVQTDEDFALTFYRFQRMPGNFSLRHAVLASSRPKMSPFLDSRFMDLTYDLMLTEYRDSGLHRRLIERGHPELLPFFDEPYVSAITTQDWHHRFPRLGSAIGLVLEDALSTCDDVFDPQGVLRMCASAIAKPDRIVYHLFRVLSFALGRQIVRLQASVWRTSVEERRRLLCATVPPA